MEQAPAPLVATSQTPYSAIERLKTFTVPVAIFAKQNALGFVAGLFLLAVIIVAIAAPVVAPYSELDSNFLKIVRIARRRKHLRDRSLGPGCSKQSNIWGPDYLDSGLCGRVRGYDDRRSFRVGQRLIGG